jgi:Zn-dependent protease/CBS domain-containing protein
MTSPPPPPGRSRPFIRLGRVRGVPVVVGPSWLVIGLMLTVVYGPILRNAVDNVSASTAYACAFGFSILFALCILAHELGHTLVCLALGYSVRRVTLFALGGVSEIEGEPKRARDELVIAGSGPLVSVLIAVGSGFGAAALPSHSLPGVLLALLGWSNAILAVFNLLPGLPLDGGRILRAIVWGCGASPLAGTRVAAWSGRVLAIGVAVSGVAADRSGSFSVVAGLASLLLAGYLWLGATQALRYAELATRLPNVALEQLLRPGLLVPADLSVAEALRRAWAGNARGLVLVDSAEHPSAIVDELLIGAVPPERRPWTSVSEVARPLEPGLVIPLGTDASGLLDRMQATPAHEYLVVAADGSPAGIITTLDFARHLRGAR